MELLEALGRIEQGLGGVDEARRIRAYLEELDQLAVGAICALRDRDMIRAWQWLERVRMHVEHARVREWKRPPPRPSPAQRRGGSEDGR